jgi:prephenate dehydratase
MTEILVPDTADRSEPGNRISRSRQPSVAYQGMAGAFGEDAVRRLWRRGAQTYPTRTFAAALTALVRGDVEWAVIPIWNSTIGVIASSHAVLAEHEAIVEPVREIDVPVRHCLLAHSGVSAGQLRFIASHPAALAQCSKLFAKLPDVARCVASDTAGAAWELAQHARASAAEMTHEPWYATLPVDSARLLGVIASRRAARRYGLAVVRQDVQDDPGNFTRFAVLRARRSTGRGGRS